MDKILRENVNKDFHQAKWNEPIIFELHQSGEVGVEVPQPSNEIVEAVGDGISSLPQKMKRTNKPNLPEIGQARVLRHYVRLSQETFIAKSKL